MTGAVIIQIAASVASVVASLAAVFMSIHNGRKIQNVHLEINSRMTELLRTTGMAERAAGAQQERNRKETPKDEQKL